MGAVSRLAGAGCAAVVVVAVAVQALTDSTALADTCYLGVLVAASVYAWVGVTRWPRRQRLMPRLIAAGVCLNAVGEITWTALVRNGVDADVSVADLAWFASYVLLCAALWVALTESHGRTDVGFLIDAVTIVVVSVLVFWRFSVDPIVEDATIPPLVRVVWSSYPVMDAVLLAIVLRIMLSQRARATVDAWFAGGVCLWLLADILYIHLPEQTAAVTIMNAAWMVAPVLMAHAAWRSPRTGTEEPEGALGQSAALPGGWVGQLLLAVCPLVVPPALELSADLRGQDDRAWQLLVGMAAVIALALVRTGRLILSEERAHRALEAARDEALAASEAKSMFMANMSHELRTPLTSVLASGELLNETRLDDYQRKLLDLHHRSGERLRSLVEGLLDFSRIEAGQTVLDFEEFDLHALMNDIVDAHLPTAQHQSIGLDWTVGPTVPQTVFGDCNRVFQVVNNVVQNALKFTEQGHVHIEICAVDAGIERFPGIQFAVTDTGIGIRPEDQASIFDSFTQVDGSATRRYEGTGLGLAIAKELTGLMGGTIEVRSELGIGSTFTIWLPLTGAGPSPDVEETGAPRRPSPSLPPLQ